MFTAKDPNNTGGSVTKEQEKSRLAALLHERHGYELRIIGAKDDGDEERLAVAEARLAAVDAELKKLGHEAEKPSTRAAKRPSGRSAETR